MSTTVKTGWLNDKNGDKFAPKTLLSQIMTSDGITLESKIESDLAVLDSNKADVDHNHNSVYETKTDASDKLIEAKDYTDQSVDFISETINTQFTELNTNLDNKVSSITVSGNQILYYLENQGEALATGTLMNATTSESGFMSASDKTKLNGIAEGANAYTLPAATSSALGGVKVGNNITNSSGTISLTSSNVTTALGYTPATQTYVTEQIQAAIQASWEASY